jgi:hypothetical protein
LILDASDGSMRRMTIEESLRALEEHAALLKFTTEAGTTSPFPPDATALAGMANAAGEILKLTRLVRRSLDAKTLSLEAK